MGTVTNHPLALQAAGATSGRGQPAEAPRTVSTLGKYQLMREIGRGAMGVVYEGWDPIIARHVAIKTIRLPAMADAESLDAIERFRREVQAAGRLSHPNIVSVFDYGETDDMAYIVMEYVDGGSLKALLDKNEMCPLADTLRIMNDLLAGLQFSHENGVIHRDIKPANVMLTRTGQVKIADFGTARVECSAMTHAGTVLGTPAYMSPEQFTGEMVDTRSDIYSAGVLFYELLTGHRLFVGTMSAIMQRVLHVDPPAPSLGARMVSPAFDGVISQAMAKHPELRFASAKAFADAIMRSGQSRAAVQDDATLIRAPGPRFSRAVAGNRPVVPSGWNAYPLGLKRGRAPKIAVAAVECMILAAGGITWLSESPRSRAPADEVAEPQPTVSPINQPVLDQTAPKPPVSETPDEATPESAASSPSAPPESDPVEPAPLPEIASQPAEQPEAGPSEPLPTPMTTEAKSATEAATDEAPPASEGPEVPAATPAPEAAALPYRDTRSSRLEAMRAKARSLPCSMLTLSEAANGLRLTGLAQTGPDLRRLITDLRSVSYLSNRTTPVSDFACAPIAAMAPLARQSEDNSLPAVAAQVDQRKIVGGSRLGIDVITTLPFVYVDLYQGDGAVRHLRPVASGTANTTHVNWFSTSSAGPVLVAAIGSKTPLDLDNRPETERAGIYLASLQAQIQNAAVPPSADLKMVQVQAPSAPPPVAPEHCARSPEPSRGFFARVFGKAPDAQTAKGTNCGLRR
jgi:serine/threonine protein kinase